MGKPPICSRPTEGSSWNRVEPRTVAPTTRGIIMFTTRSWSVAIVTLCWVGTACGSNESVNASSSPVASSVASAAPSTEARIDGCAMISPEEISSLLGLSVPGVPSGTDSAGAECTWTNTATEESVSMTISNPGTALGDELPPPEAGFPDPTSPGPDGMRFLVDGSVEFAAGDRVNTVQVAVLRLSQSERKEAAVRLAHELTPLVPR
jgi:hypothetical protein